MFVLITIALLTVGAAGGSTVLYRKARKLEDENNQLRSQLAWTKSVLNEKQSKEEEE